MRALFREFQGRLALPVRHELGQALKALGLTVAPRLDVQRQQCTCSVNGEKIQTTALLVNRAVELSATCGPEH